MTKVKQKKVKKEPVTKKYIKVKIEPNYFYTAKRQVTKLKENSRITSLQAMKAKRKKNCRKKVMKTTMHNYKVGSLKFAKSAKNPKGISVRNRKQALAIGLSYANKKC